jgi:hypothetical protein
MALGGQQLRLRTSHRCNRGAAIADCVELRKGSIITVKVLKWLADTIHNYHRQLSQLAPDWTTEWDRCEDSAICANSIIFRQQVNES